jgi:hypothetical protein
MSLSSMFSVLNNLVAVNLKRSHNHLRGIESITKMEFLRGNEDVKPSREDEASGNNTHNATSGREGENV